MSNPLNFVFDGEYRRRPEQNLGGRRSTETRQEVVRRAQAERYRRERDRKIAVAIVVLQGYARTYIVRKRLKNSRRIEFDSNKKDTYTAIELGNQMSMFNYFYTYPDDFDRLRDLSKVILSNRKLVLEKWNEDPVWRLRVRDILRNALICGGSVTVFIRLFEELTNETDTSELSLVKLSNLWIYMVGSCNFFARWRYHMESKFSPLLSPQRDPLPQLAAAFMNILRRPLNLVPKLTLTKQNFGVGKFVFSGNDAAKLILEKFTEAFAIKVIHPRGYYPPHYSGVGTHLVLPNLARGPFPYREWIRFLASRIYLKISTCRNILYSVLSLSTPVSCANPEEFFRAILPMIHSIDPASNPARPELYQEHDDSDEMDVTFAEEGAYTTYMQQTITILSVFEPLLNSIPIVDWLDSGFDQNWELLCPIISLLARFERKRVFYQFEFLSVLAYKREFMSCLYLKIERARTIQLSVSSNRNMEDLFVFCFLFTHLMSTLHDAEFIQAMPMTRWQLTEFIVYLKEVFADIIINGKDEYRQGFMCALGEGATNALMLLYERNTRIPLFQDGTFLSNSLRVISPVQTHALEFMDFAQSREPRDIPLTSADQKLLRILQQFPFCLSFHDRVSAWHRLLDLDRAQRYSPHGLREQIQIRRSHIYEDAYEKLSPDNVPDMRDNIRISLVNVVGAQEAGVDGGGLLREFLSEATRAGVDPNRGLFRLDSQNRIYPNPVAKKIDPKYGEHFFLMGRLVGKALYEQTLLELPLAAFFIQTCISGKIECAVDFLATLDSGLHKNLLALKTYHGDWNALGLDFTVTLEEFGDMRTVELKEDGAAISVDESNVIKYIHLVADYKINKEMESECNHFRNGLFNVVPILKMFSWREMQTLISGSDKSIDIEDWMKFTHYAGGYTENHPTIELFWQVLRSFSETHLRKLLKFVTSCSRPPILGFKDLVPNFGIQNAGSSDRLPTAATCMNLLKLPEFTELDTLREKLIYAIDAQAGFELS